MLLNALLTGNKEGTWWSGLSWTCFTGGLLQYKQGHV